MATTSRRTTVMRVRVVAAVVALVFVVGLGVAAASPPPTAAFDDFDGRTWLAVPRAAGSHLLLVNGISGSLEAEAFLDPPPPSVAFGGATRRHTLLRTPDSLLVVDNATHAVVRRPLAAAAQAALLGDDVLVVSDRVTRIPIGSQAEPLVVAGAPAPVPDAKVVVDGDGQPWYLGRRSDRTMVAVAVAPGGESDARSDPPRTIAVPGTTRSLLVIDGRVFALGDSLVTIDGKQGPVVPEGLLPEVAEGTRGTWASATSSTLTIVRDGKAETSDLGSQINALAVWHGSVFAATATGVIHVSPDGTDLLPEIGGDAALHVDGGLLWATTPETAVAIDPDQQQVILRLAAADLSLCVGDCSAAAASTFLDQAASDAPAPTPPTPKPSAGEGAPPTTEAPRVLAPAVVTPSLPTTTLPRPAATTTPLPDSGSPPSSTSPVPEVAPESIPSTTTPTSTLSPTSTSAPPRDNDKDGSPATLPRPVDPKPTTTTTTIVTTTPTTEPPPTEPPPTEPPPTETAAPVELEYSLRAGRRSATADIRVLGRPSDCGATGVATTATVSWTGSDSGSREVLIIWPQRDSSRSSETSATIVAPPGELEVTVTVCGVAATRTTTIEDDPEPTTTTTTTTTTPEPTTTAGPTTTDSVP